MTLNINEVVINNTTISLIRDNSNIFINDLNLINKSNKAKSIAVPKIVLKNSIIELKDKNANNNIKFKINTLIASNNNTLNIDTNFFHESSSDPITFIYRGLGGDNNYKSRIYISGNNVKLPYKLLPTSFKQILPVSGLPSIAYVVNRSPFVILYISTFSCTLIPAAFSKEMSISQEPS